MRKLFLLLTAFALVLSCSSDETSTPVTPPAPIVKYTITLSAGEGGTVSTTGGEYEAGQTVSVTATPQGEYLFTSWSDGITDATRTITVNSNSTLTANFEKKKYPLTVNIEGEGEVLEEIVNSGRTTDYDSGTTVKLTAEPADEWLFTGWSGDIGDIDPTENPIQLSIIESKTVTATFEKKKYTLTVNIEGEGEVIEEIVNAGRTTDYNSGTTVKLTAVPAEGWEFVGWTGAIESEELEVQLLVSEAKEVNAVFQKKNLTLNLGTVDGGRILNLDSLTSKTYFYGDTITLTAEAQFQKEFVEWSGDYISKISTIDIIIKENMSITATFQNAPYRVGTDNIYGKGEIIRERENKSQNIHFSSGSYTTLEAVPEEGWSFHSWFGDVNSTENPITIEITEEFNNDINIRPTFYKSNLDIKISAINYIHSINRYPIDQFLYSIIDVSGTSWLKTNEPRIIFSGTSTMGADPNKYLNDYEPTKSFELKKTNDSWEFHKFYDLEKWSTRLIKVKNDKVLMLGGNEIGPTSLDWFGNMYFGKITDTDIIWEKVNDSQSMGFFHSGSFGDFNGDGNFDVVGVSGTPPNGQKSFFTSSNSGKFSLFKHSTPVDGFDFDFSAELYDLDKDGKDEIISRTSDGLTSYKYNSESNKFEVFKKQTGLIFNSPTSAQVVDFNGDGIIDLCVAGQAEDGGRTIEVMYGNENGTFETIFFEAYDYISHNEAGLIYQEFTILDANEDGKLDIILHGQGGTLAQEKQIINGRELTKINLSKFIFLNDGSGGFKNPTVENIILGSEIIYLIPYLENNQLYFMGPNHINTDGIKDLNYQNNTLGFKIWDIKIKLD